jgi:hypothetical protein
MADVHCYYYLHENGEIIWKPAIVAVNDPEYFHSPYVKKLWIICTFEDMTKFIQDLQEMGHKGPRGGIYW